MPHAESLSAIASIGYHAQAGNAIAPGFGDGRGAIGRPVIYNQHFRVRPLIADIIGDFLKRRGQPLLLIERRNNDGEFRGGDHWIPHSFQP